MVPQKTASFSLFIIVELDKLCSMQVFINDTARITWFSEDCNTITRAKQNKCMTK